jgi:predicted DNA-binding protein
MRTIRFGTELEQEIETLSQANGQTPSEFVREAVRSHIAQVKGKSLLERWGDAIGCVDSGNPKHNAKDRKKELTAALDKKHPRKRARRNKP